MEYYVFKHPYLLIEDETGKCRPFHREYKGDKKEDIPPKVVLVTPSEQPQKKPLENKRPGACEICLVKYPDYSAHIKDEDHRKALEDACEYVVLDQVIEQIKRANSRSKSRRQLFQE